MSQPVISFIHRLCATGRFEPTRNQWLRVGAGILGNILCVCSCQGHVTLTSVNVTAANTDLRLPKPQAITTRIYNPPGNPAIQVTENIAQNSNTPAPIGRIPPGGVMSVPLGGRFKLTAHAESAGSWPVTIRTIERCDCLNPHVYGQSEEDPIGGQLL